MVFTVHIIMTEPRRSLCLFDIFNGEKNSSCMSFYVEWNNDKNRDVQLHCL